MQTTQQVVRPRDLPQSSSPIVAPERVCLAGSARRFAFRQRRSFALTGGPATSRAPTQNSAWSNAAGFRLATRRHKKTACTRDTDTRHSNRLSRIRRPRTEHEDRRPPARSNRRARKIRCQADGSCVGVLLTKCARLPASATDTLVQACRRGTHPPSGRLKNRMRFTRAPAFFFSRNFAKKDAFLRCRARPLIRRLSSPFFASLRFSPPACAFFSVSA